MFDIYMYIKEIARGKGICILCFSGSLICALGHYLHNVLTWGLCAARIYIRCEACQSQSSNVWEVIRCRFYKRNTLKHCIHTTGHCSTKYSLISMRGRFFLWFCKTNHNERSYIQLEGFIFEGLVPTLYMRFVHTSCRNEILISLYASTNFDD